MAFKLDYFRSTVQNCFQSVVFCICVY